MADVDEPAVAPAAPAEETSIADEASSAREMSTTAAAAVGEEDSAQEDDLARDEGMEAAHDILGPDGEPLLTAEELRALLQEQPSASDARGSEE